MLPHYRKFFVFTAFFTMFFCWQTAAAQEQKNTADLLEKIDQIESKEARPKENLENLPETFNPLTEISTHDGNIEAELNKNAESNAGNFKYNLHLIKADKRKLSLDVELIENSKSVFPQPNRSTVEDDDDSASGDLKKQGFQWRAAIGQSLMFLAVQHGYAFTQPKTREAIKGKFWKDYAKSVKSLRGWDDGGRFFTNYIAHPMQGSLTGFIYVQNDPKAMKQQFGASGDYWRSRAKAMLWTTAWSTQFEIGPISQASIGNVGLKGKQTWEDIIVTPTLGTAMLVAEDAVDRFIMQRIERRTDNFYIKIFARMLLSPTRVFANMLRFKEPWHRDRPMAR